MSIYLNRIARDRAIEQSLDAAIELGEVISGRLTDSPALVTLIETMLGTHADLVAGPSNDLHCGPRMASLYRRALSPPQEISVAPSLDHVLTILREAHGAGLSTLPETVIQNIRDFCLGLNRELVSEAFSATRTPPLARSGHGRVVA